MAVLSTATLSIVFSLKACLLGSTWASLIEAVSNVSKKIAAREFPSEGYILTSS